MLYSIIGISLITNTIRVFLESKALKKQGKTPLTGKSLTTVFVAAVAESVAVVLFTFLISAHFEPSTLSVIIVFTAIYIIKDGFAYLSAWGLWSLFVSIDKKKMEKEIEEDQKEALS